MTRVLHPIAGAIAILTIASFWVSTALSELLGSPSTVAAVKTAIPWGFLLLVPALAGAGGSGVALAKGQKQGRVGAKAARMPYIALNGVLVLVPSALFLAARAKAGHFDGSFYAVQALELAAGATNLVLLALSMRDGLAATAWRRSGALRALPTHTVRLVGREEIARGTLAFRLDKPAGFSFRAGQAIYIALVKPPERDGRGSIRTFSIASAPHEAELVVAIRRGSSSFKRALSALPPNSVVQIEGPFGNLALPGDSDRPVVMLAGGMGVTPFRSMILEEIARRSHRRLVLFCSNRSPEETPFLPELSALAAENPELQFVPTITADEPRPDWVGERGPITMDMLSRNFRDATAAVFLVAGPPGMVEVMTSMLRELGVARSDIRAEPFPGY